MRPVCRVDDLIRGGETAGAAQRQEALQLARLQAEEEVRPSGAVDALLREA